MTGWNPFLADTGIDREFVDALSEGRIGDYDPDPLERLDPLDSNRHFRDPDHLVPTLLSQVPRLTQL